MSNKRLTLRELLKLLNKIPEEKLDYEIWSDTDESFIQLSVDDRYKAIELMTK